MKRCVKVSLRSDDKIKDFLSLNSKSRCDIDVESRRSFIDGKSLLGLLSLDLMNPLNVFLIGDSDMVEDLVHKYENRHLMC